MVVQNHDPQVNPGGYQYQSISQTDRPAKIACSHSCKQETTQKSLDWIAFALVTGASGNILQSVNRAQLTVVTPKTGTWAVSRKRSVSTPRTGPPQFLVWVADWWEGDEVTINTFGRVVTSGSGYGTFWIKDHHYSQSAQVTIFQANSNEGIFNIQRYALRTDNSEKQQTG